MCGTGIAADNGNSVAECACTFTAMGCLVDVGETSAAQTLSEQCNAEQCDEGVGLCNVPVPATVV